MPTLATRIAETEFRERYALFLESYRLRTGDALMQRLDWRTHMHAGCDVAYFGVPGEPCAVAALAWMEDDQVWEWYGGLLSEGFVWVPVDLRQLPHHDDRLDLFGTVLWDHHTIDDLFQWAEHFEYPIAFAPWPTWILPATPVEKHLSLFSRRTRRLREASRYSVTWSTDVAGMMGRAATFYGEDFLLDNYGLRDRIISAPRVESLRDWRFDVVTVADDRGPASEALLLSHANENTAFGYTSWTRRDAPGASFAMMLEFLHFTERRDLSKIYLMFGESRAKLGWKAAQARRIAISTGNRQDWF